MSLYALIRSHPNPTEELVEEFVSGNLCRCTGYRSILDAGKTVILFKLTKSWLIQKKEFVHQLENLVNVQGMKTKKRNMNAKKKIVASVSQNMPFSLLSLKKDNSKI